MISSIVNGYTYHKRFSPKAHSFEYRYFQFFFDLDEVEDISYSQPLIGHNSFSVYSYYERDHLTHNNKSLKKDILDEVSLHYPHFKAQKVYHVTGLRFMGYVFNPVSFFIVTDDKNKFLSIAQVTNTFYEIKRFFSEIKEYNDDFFDVESSFDKSFYISPYSSSKGQIKFNIKIKLGHSIRISVFNIEEGKTNLQAGYIGKFVPLTKLNILKSVVKYPFQAQLVWLAIHFQAGLLFLKKLKFYKKMEEISEQKGFKLWKLPQN